MLTQKRLAIEIRIVRIKIWSHLMKKSLMENMIFCAVKPLSFNKFLFLVTTLYI